MLERCLNGVGSELAASREVSISASWGSVVASPPQKFSPTLAISLDIQGSTSPAPIPDSVSRGRHPLRLRSALHLVVLSCRASGPNETGAQTGPTHALPLAAVAASNSVWEHACLPACAVVASYDKVHLRLSSSAVLQCWLKCCVWRSCPRTTRSTQRPSASCSSARRCPTASLLTGICQASPAPFLFALPPRAEAQLASVQLKMQMHLRT